MYSGVNFLFKKKVHLRLTKMRTLRVLSVLLKLKEIYLQSEQCIFVAYELRSLPLWENDPFITATLRSLDWNNFLGETLALHRLHSSCCIESQHRYYVSFPSVDKHRIQPFIGCSYEHTIFFLHVFSQCASFKCWLWSDTGGIAMTEEVLTPTEMLEIM